MNWSKEPPTEPGAYMVKDGDFLLPAFLDQGDIDRGRFACFSGNGHYAISTFEWWFGPIPQPEEEL